MPSGRARSTCVALLDGGGMVRDDGALVDTVWVARPNNWPASTRSSEDSRARSLCPSVVQCAGDRGGRLGPRPVEFVPGAHGGRDDLIGAAEVDRAEQHGAQFDTVAASPSRRPRVAAPRILSWSSANRWSMLIRAWPSVTIMARFVSSRTMPKNPLGPNRSCTNLSCSDQPETAPSRTGQR